VAIGKEGLKLENTWWITDRDNNALSTATHTKEPGSRHIITSIYAAYSDIFSGTLVVKADTIAIATIDIQGKVELSNIEVDVGVNKDVVIELSASGEAGVYGSFLINGYTK